MVVKCEQVDVAPGAVLAGVEQATVAVAAHYVLAAVPGGAELLGAVRALP